MSRDPDDHIAEAAATRFRLADQQAHAFSHMPDICRRYLIEREWAREDLRSALMTSGMPVEQGIYMYRLDNNGDVVGLRVDRRLPPWRCPYQGRPKTQESTNQP